MMGIVSPHLYMGRKFYLMNNMKIQTKLDVDSEAYVLLPNGVHVVKIKHIDIKIVSFDLYSIAYIVYQSRSTRDYTNRFDESNIFSTKQKLLKTL